MSARGLYVQVFPNKFEVRDVTDGKMSQGISSKPFSSPRLLIADFELAAATLRSVIASLVPRTFLKPRWILMHPRAMTEGGLAKVEQRLFSELAEACGASRSSVWIGPVLSDAECIAKLSEVRSSRSRGN